MATARRIYFVSKPHKYPVFDERELSFEYFGGFAVSQKQKSIRSFHNAITELDDTLRVIEISTKSTVPLGVALSAFNLKLHDGKTNKDVPVENVFQSSKVFEHGGPYRDLLEKSPKDAKRDERLTTSGKLKCFEYGGEEWGLEPKSMFYDWLYIHALKHKEALYREILRYNAFTDIEFNHKKSVNCQARSVAIFASIMERDCLSSVLEKKERFRELYLGTGNVSK